MCVVVPHPLGKGTRCAPPLHPPGCGQVRALSPNMASKTYRRFITRRAWRSPSPPAPNHGPALRRWTGSGAIAPPEPHSQGDFGSPCTHQLGRRSCPKTPDHFMETNPARFGCALSNAGRSSSGSHLLLLIRPGMWINTEVYFRNVYPSDTLSHDERRWPPYTY